MSESSRSHAVSPPVIDELLGGLWPESAASLLKSVFVVAEIGVNHDGSLRKAKKLALMARDSGADAVKIQSFIPRLLARTATPKVPYQSRRDGDSRSHREMLDRLALSWEDQERFFDYCRAHGIEAFSTPYDPLSASLLAQRSVKFMKVASADIVDFQLLEVLAQSGIPTILSTGMATIHEISGAVSFFRAHSCPIALLHAVSQYPVALENLNLRWIAELHRIYGGVVGFSDHSIGWRAGSAAVFAGAQIVEKHFTDNRKAPGPDHYASADPATFAKFVREVRRAEMIRGHLKIDLELSELAMKMTSRKSLVVVRDVPLGAIIRKEDVAMLRPGSGLSGPAVLAAIGARANRALVRGEELALDDFTPNAES